MDTDNLEYHLLICPASEAIEKAVNELLKKNPNCEIISEPVLVRNYHRKGSDGEVKEQVAAGIFWTKELWIRKKK